MKGDRFRSRRSCRAKGCSCNALGTVVSVLCRTCSLTCSLHDHAAISNRVYLRDSSLMRYNNSIIDPGALFCKCGGSQLSLALKSPLQDYEAVNLSAKLHRQKPDSSPRLLGNHLHCRFRGYTWRIKVRDWRHFSSVNGYHGWRKRQ